jgi:hypothetical protein
MGLFMLFSLFISMVKSTSKIIGMGPESFFPVKRQRKKI